MTKRQFGLAAVLLAVGLLAAAGARADTLTKIRAAGVLRCGSNGAGEDYTFSDTHGDIGALAAEICRAVAIAVLGPNGRIEAHVWPDEQHLLASLHAGTTDLAVGVAPRIDTAAAFGVGFAPPVFYDGQALLARAGIAAAAGLAAKQVCFVEDGSLAETLHSWTHATGLAVMPFPFSERGEMLNAAGAGRCAAITGDVSQLIHMRAELGTGAFHLLSDRLSMDPIAPTFRADDPRWASVVTAVVETLIQAEASGITAANAARRQASDDPVLRRLIGTGSAGTAHLLGLPDPWALTMLRAVGNYGEIFDRTLGRRSPFDLPRGANQPWTQGGAMCAVALY